MSESNPRNKESYIALDVTPDTLSGNLWRILPDATPLQHQVLRTFITGFVTFFKLYVNYLVAADYPDSPIRMKAKLSTTPTDGSVYLAVVGHDEVEYMKITVTKDTINQHGIGEGGQIRLYQNPKNRDKQVLKAYSGLPKGWDVTGVYQKVRDITFEMMAIFKAQGLYSRINRTGEDRVLLEVSYRQKPVNVNSLMKGEQMLHTDMNSSEPVNEFHEARRASADFRRSECYHKLLPKSSVRIQLQPTLIPLGDVPVKDKATKEGRDANIDQTMMSEEIIRRAIDSGDEVVQPVVEESTAVVDDTKGLALAILKGVMDIVQNNTALGLPSNVMPEKMNLKNPLKAIVKWGLKLKFG
jgi:hypothetical protein